MHSEPRHTQSSTQHYLQRGYQNVRRTSNERLPINETVEKCARQQRDQISEVPRVNMNHPVRETVLDDQPACELATTATNSSTMPTVHHNSAPDESRSPHTARTCSSSLPSTSEGRTSSRSASAGKARLKSGTEGEQQGGQRRGTEGPCRRRLQSARFASGRTTDLSAPIQ